MRSVFFAALLLLLGAKNVEKPFVSIICSYNNSSWYEKNLSSILRQKYSNHRILYIDDCSSDHTADLVANYLKSKRVDYKLVHFYPTNTDHTQDTEEFKRLVNLEKHQVIIVRNEANSGPLANFYRAAHSCNAQEVLLRIDGDDWLIDHHVFAMLNQIYRSKNVYLTHGKFVEYPTQGSYWSIPIPEKYIQTNSFRQYRCPSHLFTCYAWLYQKVKLEDQLWNGKFFPVTGDQALIFPCIEMAAERHAFVDKTIYVYNVKNPIAENKVHTKLQNEAEAVIRARKPYQRLSDQEALADLL